MEIFDFSVTSDLADWFIMDDVVMGGRSDGNCIINSDGIGVFYGKVSLENNGGFSSVRYRFGTKKVNGYTTCKIRLKGDGKSYQFRVKTDKYDRHSYVYKFETTGEWETINIPLNAMYPSFRGRLLDIPNYPISELEEIAFLISNKVNESFRLELDRIDFE